MKSEETEFLITPPSYIISLNKNRKCNKCGEVFKRNQPKENMLKYAIIKYCGCGNRIVIGYDGKVYEK